MTRRLRAVCLLVLLGLAGSARGAERSVSSYLPADAWLTIHYDGTHPGVRETPLHAFFQEPEVKAALVGLRPLYDKLMEDAKEEGGADLDLFFRWAAGCECAFALTAPREGKEEPSAVLAANVGAAEGETRRQAEAFLKQVVAAAQPDTARQVQIGQLQATCYANKKGEPGAFVFDGSMLIAGNGEEVLRKALDPGAPKAPAPAGDRAALRVRYDHRAMLKAFGNQMGPDAKRMLDAIGLNALSAAELAFIPRGKRLVTSLAIELPGGAGRQGLLRGLADAAPYDPELLKFVPADASYFWLAGIDFAWVWDEVLAAVARVDAAAANNARKGLAAFEQKMGVKVRDGLLAPLGSGTLLVGRSEGLMGGWSAIVQRVKDPEALDKAISQLAARLDIVLMGMHLGAVRTDLKAFQYRGHTCRYLWMMGGPALILPYWTLCYTRVGDTFVFAPKVLQLKAFLDSLEDKGPRIAENEEFRGLLAAVPKGATSLGYANWGDPVQAIYNTVAPLFAALQGAPDFEGKLDLANLPSSRLLRRYCRGTVSYTTFEDGRFRLEAQSDGLDVLGPNAVLAVPALLAGMTLPAMANARTEARRIRDRNNLNHIAKACAIYLNEHGDNRFYPTGLAELVDKKCIEKELLVSPLDPDPPKLANGVPCSYASIFDRYPDRVFLDDFPPNDIMAWNRRPFPQGGRNVLFFDSHVEFWLDEARFQEELKGLDEKVKKLTKERVPGKAGEPKPGPAKGEF